MPLFDIKCDNCGAVWEETLKHSKVPVGTCPECGSAYTRVFWKSMPVVGGVKPPWEDPYRFLDGHIPDSPTKFVPPKGGWKSAKES